MPIVENAIAYPLSWPATTPRTLATDRSGSAFKKRDWDKLIAELRMELKHLGADEDSVIISTNQPVRKDGAPFAAPRNIADPGVAVYFALEGQRVCFPCDRFTTLANNLRAITLHIEAMRGQQRWGVGTSRQAFAGYAALPASTEENCWTVLDLKPGSSEADILQSYRTLVKTAHPDNGGSNEEMAKLNIARGRALEEIRRG